jgi:hypothetical protein
MRRELLAGVVFVAVAVSACEQILGDFKNVEPTTSGTGGESAGATSASVGSGTGGACAMGMRCDGECIDPASDNENCGSCGNVCGGASFCKGSMCTCITTGQTYCAPAGCTDTTTDVANCGGCGTACASGMACVGGHCGPDGTACTGADACSSGNCVGGVCCATACTDQGAASCGHNGKCEADGSACAFYAAGTTCGTATCSGSTLTPAAACNGSGACKAGTAGACPGNFKCASAQGCVTTCTAATDCAAAKYECGTIGATMGQCLLVSGQPCTVGDQCASDGCSGTCL